MADREEFATAVGALIKGRAPQSQVTALSAAVDRKLELKDFPVGGDVNAYTTTDDWAIYASDNALNLPGTDKTGRLQVTAWTLTVADQVWTPWTRYPQVWHRQYVSGTWTAWQRIDGGIALPIIAPNGFNADAAAISTTYQVASTITATNLPTTGGGILRTYAVQSGVTVQEWVPVEGATWKRSRTPTGWIPWEQPGTDSVPPTVDSSSEQRAVRVSRARARRGIIGTAGLAAVAFRFDDYSADFHNIILPILRKYQLPATVASAIRWFEDTTLGPSVLNDWLAVTGWMDDGINFAGHSWTHGDAQTEAGILHEIIESADYLEQMVPGAVVESWTKPSFGDPAGDYIDFGHGDQVDRWWETIAGRAMMRRYPNVWGYAGGTNIPLTGELPVGSAHLTFEASTLAYVQQQVREAQQRGSGLTLMAHPPRLGEVGKMSLADFDALCAWLAAERDAGRLLVLTMDGIAVADSGQSRRVNLLLNTAFDGLTNWSGTGWTTSGGIASTTTGGTLTQLLRLAQVAYHYGATFEVTAEVLAPSGAVVRAGVSGDLTASTDVTLPASPEWTRVTRPFTLPTTLAASPSVTAVLGRVSGGDVSMRNPAVRPI